MSQKITEKSKIIFQQSKSSLGHKIIHKIRLTSYISRHLQFIFIYLRISNFQWIWKLIFIIVSFVFAILLNKIYNYQTLEYFQNIRNGSVQDFIIYGIPFAIVFSIKLCFIQCFDLIYHYMLDDLCQKYYMDGSKFPNEKLRKNRAYSLVKWSYSIVYYLISSLWAFSLLRNTSYFPPWLGGIHVDGGFHNLHKFVPYQFEVTHLMKVFYIFQFGKHFSRFFNHVFVRNEGNFFEYTLHHGLSTFLIIFSYLMNMWIIGIWVLLIHDLTECSLIFMRGYDSYKYKKAWISYITYINLGVFWISGRVVLFWFSLVYEPIKQMLEIGQYKLLQVEIQYEILFFPYLFMIFMLACLFLMQVYWTYCITQGILKRTLVKSIKTAYE